MILFRKLLCSAAASLLLLATLPTALASGSHDTVLPIGGEDSGMVNLLLIGQDRREDNLPARSDSIILCSLRPGEKTITITSFLRDLYVEIPGFEGNRINAAYANGGMELLRQTMEENFGLVIDGCIEVDFSNFSQIIDVLGGVTIELRQDEAEVINASTGSSLTEGSQLLTGEEALAYSRIRSLDSDGDFSRTGRQRQLILSLLNSYQNAGLLTILSAAADTIPLISTDLETKELLVLAARLFPLLDNPEIISQRIPFDGTYSYERIRNMEVLTADMETLRSQLRKTLCGSEETSS